MTNICEPLPVISVKHSSLFPDDGSHTIRNMLEWFLILCLLNFYTTQVLTSKFCIIECISQLIKVTYVSQQCISYTPTCFDIFVSSSGSSHLCLARLHNFSKLQLLKIQFQKIKMFHIKSHKFLDYGRFIYYLIKYFNALIILQNCKFNSHNLRTYAT